jgi:hypothetical protein
MLFFEMNISTDASDDDWAKVQEVLNAMRATRDFKRANEEGVDFNVTKNGKEIQIKVIGVAPSKFLRRRCP